jgi:hypothetical protein
MAREGEKSSFSFIYSRNHKDRLWRGECVLKECGDRRMRL